MIKKLIASLYITCCFNGLNAQDNYTNDWESLKQHKAVSEWFANAKLGVYFHWGVYSVPDTDGEWYLRWMYVPDRDDNLWGGRKSIKSTEKLTERTFNIMTLFQCGKLQNLIPRSG